jgi:predicted nucleotidyltransferase
MAVNSIQFTKIEIQIAKYLFKHYKGRYNARQLAKMLDINHAHANKLCNLLADKKLLVKEEIGNSIFFSYGYYNKLAIKFMEYLLSLEEKEFPKWLSVLSHSLKKFKDCIEMCLVFGSSIKTKDFNDIDVLIVYDAKKSKGIKRIKDEIRKSELIEKPIRYVDITEKDILLNKEDKIFYNMLSESLVFHNPEKYAEVIRKCHKQMSI